MLSATPMHGCFQKTPFSAVANRIKIEEMNPPLREPEGQTLAREQ
jgi:hypothetical protein